MVSRPYRITPCARPATSSAIILLTLCLVAAPARAQDRGSAWGLTLSSQASMNSNITFQPNRGPQEVVGRLSGGLSRVQQTGRFSLQAMANTSRTFHKERSELDRGSYSGSLSAGVKLGRKMHLNVSDRVAFTYTTDQTGLGDLVDPTVQLRLASTRRNIASAAINYQMGKRLAFNVSGSHSTAKFLGAPDLIGGQSLGAGAGLSFGIGRNDSFSLGYSYGHTDTRRGDIDGHSASFGWSRPIGRSVTATAELGASQTLSMGQNPVNGIGELSLAYSPRVGRLSLRVSRRISHAYGLGRDHLADRGSLSYSRLIGRKLSWSTSATYSQSHDPVDPTFKTRTQSANMSLGYPVARKFSLSGNYNFNRSDPSGSGPAVLSHAGSVALSYGLHW